MVATRCPHCDAKMVRYKHRLSQKLVDALFRLYEAGGRSHLSDLGMSRSQWDNFQKLRYFGLARKAYDSNGSRINGVWEITTLGQEFIDGYQSVKASVWTYRGRTVRFSDEIVHISDYDNLDKYFRQRHDYVDDQEPFEEGDNDDNN